MAEKKRPANIDVPNEPVEPKWDSVEYTEPGIARLLVDLYGGQMLYVELGPKESAWFVRRADDGRWFQDFSHTQVYTWLDHIGGCMRAYMARLIAETPEGKEPPKIVKVMRPMVGTLGRNSGIESVLRSAARFARQAHISDFDADPRALACENGVLYLTDEKPFWEFKEWSEVDAHEALFFMNTGIEFKKGATHRYWESALNIFLPDAKVRAFEQRKYGSALEAGNPSALLSIAFSERPNTGKTTISKACVNALGDYAGFGDGSLLRGKFQGGIDEGLARVVRKRLVVVAEAGSQWELHGDRIKALSGGEEVAYQRKWGHEESRVPDFTVVITCNSMPKIKGFDLASGSRVWVTEYENYVAEKDDTARRLEGQRVKQAILYWLLKGWCAYKRRGLDPPLNVVEVTMAQQAHLSLVTSFREEMCTTGDERPDRLWDAFSRWQLEAEIPPPQRLDKLQFQSELRGLGHMTGASRRVVGCEGVPTHARLGIALTSAAKQRYGVTDA